MLRNEIVSILSELTSGFGLRNGEARLTPDFDGLHNKRYCRQKMGEWHFGETSVTLVDRED